MICYHKTKSLQDAFSYIESLAVEKADIRVGGKALSYLTTKLVEEGDYQNALANCSSQEQKFAQTDIAKDALFTKWHIYFDGLNDAQNAKLAINQFEYSFPEDYLFAIMKNAMGEWTPELEKQFMQSSYKRFSDEGFEEAGIKKPKAFALFGNYPNPLNPETTIKYALPEKSHVIIEVYNVLGQRIVQLIDVDMPAGYHKVHWDGRNELGQKVSAGVYLCYMRAGDFVKTQKMTLLP